MLLTRTYDYGWAALQDFAAMDLEQACREVFGSAIVPVLARERLKVNTARFRMKVRRTVYQKGRAWHRELSRRNLRQPSWPKFNRNLSRIPQRGPVGRSRALMLARGRRIYGEK
jgi:hypothetical protein